MLNVFTAKGLFRWDSPYHLGTAGLQLHDFALAGLAPNRPILAVGVGLDECPDPILRDAGLSPDGAWPVTRVATERLGSLGGLVRAAHDGPPVLGELYQRLSGVAQPLYRVEDVPLNPARAAADVGESLPEGGVVTLEPSTAGWWVARTLPTTQLGSVRVPAAGRPGLAVAAALLASIEGRPAVAVVEAPVGPENRALIELAHSRDADLVVAVRGDAGDITSPEEHRELLRAAAREAGDDRARGTGRVRRGQRAARQCCGSARGVGCVMVRTGPLQGIRILDLSIAATGPLACALLADQGAEVIKVERPGIGDIGRWVGVSVNGMSALYAACNRGKRCIAVDVHTDEGRDIVRRLARDVRRVRAELPSRRAATVSASGTTTCAADTTTSSTSRCRASARWARTPTSRPTTR